MRRFPGWIYLAGVFAAFWILFATILIVADFPFLVISGALTTLALMSALVVALARAYFKSS